MLGSSATHRITSKNRMRAALNIVTQYEEDGNDFLEQIITGDESWILCYKPERKSTSMIWKTKKKGWENSRMNGPPGG